MLFVDAGLGEQAAVGAGRADGYGGFEVLQGARLLAADGGGAAEAVVHAGDENLGKESFADAPVLGEAEVLFGFRAVADLQVTCSGQQRELGAIRVVLQGVAVELGQAFPVTKLPLGAGAFEQIFIVGDAMGGGVFVGMSEFGFGVGALRLHSGVWSPAMATEPAR